ncbi:hypothetical protein SSX86_008433 [Deinandra increscens subsp. villosa]|uniref:F-box domain-containing protein n=1 Tax=Deinandra increscens subsp. villosa TaxID=3103831 RepID=A0AAP0H4I8_9ASTR
MDKLPHSVLLQILSRLNDSADVACCRVAWKAFDTVSPGIRSIHLQCSKEWYDMASSSQRIKPLKTVFLDLISKLETVESVCIVFVHWISRASDDFSLTDGDFAEWLPRVSGSLKSLSVSNYDTQSPSNVLVLISAYCCNLVSLKLDSAWLNVRNLNPMPTLTKYKAPREAGDSEFSLRKVFTVFPNVSSLCIQSEPWSELETYMNSYPEGWMILDGRKGLKTICAYLELADPSLTFSFLSCILDQCVGLSEVSLLMHIEDDIQRTIADSFWSKCVARWPGLKWRRGIRMSFMEDLWISDAISN